MSLSALCPTGLYALRPVLSNETILGVEKVTAMQRRLAATGTMVGINGDFYAPDTGRPSGVLMRDGVVDSPPSGDRSSVGLSPEGANRHPAGRVLRHLARPRAAPDAHGHEPGAEAERDLALHAQLRSYHAAFGRA